MPGGNGRGPIGGRGREKRHGGRGMGGGFVQGPGGECICPNCGYKEIHQLGVPCYNKKCPKCGSSMTRA